MPKRPLISREAVRDLEEIWEYIAEDSLASADLFIDEIVIKCCELVQLKGVGHRRDDLISGLLSVAFRKYVIFFQRRGNKVEIVRILHGARDIRTVFKELS